MTNEQLVRERFAKDVAEHVITIKHSHGLYRHYRCQRPRSWCMGFDIVAWPGSLCYTGDMGDYLFQRTDNMVEFMRTAVRDRGYAAQKCVTKHDIKEWREDLFRKALADRLKEAKTIRVMRHGSFRDESVLDKIREITAAYDEYSSQHDAVKAMYESGLWDGCDLPECTDYTHAFLWCLHAIQWFCEHVHEAKEKPRERYASRRVVAVF